MGALVFPIDPNFGSPRLLGTQEPPSVEPLLISSGSLKFVGASIENWNEFSINPRILIIGAVSITTHRTAKMS